MQFCANKNFQYNYIYSFREMKWGKNMKNPFRKQNISKSSLKGLLLFSQYAYILNPSILLYSAESTLINLHQLGL